MTLAKSVFANLHEQAWPFRYAGQLTVECLVGGTPFDEKVAEGWLKTKWAASDDLIRDEIARVMVERNLTKEQATEQVDLNRHLTGFKADDTGLFIEGRQLKAAIKEAVSCAVASGKLQGPGWGRTSKGILSYMAEHAFVIERKLYIHDETGNIVQKAKSADEDSPVGVMQNFVHTWRGNGIKYEQYVENAVLNFTVWSDHPFTAEQWAHIWMVGEFQGIGASRSQSYGRYAVTRWDEIGEPVTAKPKWPTAKSAPAGIEVVAKAGRKTKTAAEAVDSPDDDA